MTAELQNSTTEKVKNLQQKPNEPTSKTEKMLIEQKKIKIETKSLNQANEKEKLKLLGEDRARELVEEFKKEAKERGHTNIWGDMFLSTYKGKDFFASDLAICCRENLKQHGGLLLKIYGETIAIPPKSPLLQVLQCYLLSREYSISDGNKKNSIESIDGVFANDSLDALMSWQKNRYLQREINSKTDKYQLQMKWLKDIFADFQRKLEEDTKEIPELQKERNLEVIDLLGGEMLISSYGQSTNIDIGKGELSVSSKKNRLEFPFRLTLDTDSDTNTFSRNESNAERLRRLYGLANIINRAQSLSEKIRHKSADNFQPFHIDKLGLSSRIEVENGMSDLNLIKIENLEPYAKVFKMSVNVFAKVLVDFLNKIHDANYRPTPSSIAQGSGGGRTI